jgi:hypothetical protein
MALSGAQPSFSLARDIFSRYGNSRQKSIKAHQDFHGTISKVKKFRYMAETNQNLENPSEGV